MVEAKSAARSLFGNDISMPDPAEVCKISKFIIYVQIYIDQMTGHILKEKKPTCCIDKHIKKIIELSIQ